MLRISKLADYGTVVLAHIAQDPTAIHSAKDIAAQTHIKRPTVNKLLKLLAKGGLLSSCSGRYGGYCLAIQVSDISLMDVIDAVEGKMALTECSHADGHCDLESICRIQTSFQAINSSIENTLKSINITTLLETAQQTEAPIKFAKAQ